MGRTNHIPGLFAKLGQKDLRSAAYRSLSFAARSVLIELEMSYWENNRQNPLPLPLRWLADKMDMNSKTAAKALHELEDCGFVELDTIGKMSGPPKDRATVYRLTWQPTNDGFSATFDHRRWIPSPFYGGPGGTTSTQKNTGAHAPKKASQRFPKRRVGEARSVADNLDQPAEFQGDSKILTFPRNRRQRT